MGTGKKGVRPHLPERPGGCFAQMGPDPFFASGLGMGNMAQAPLFIGLDVGGTSMKGGVVDDQGRPLGSVNLPTEAYKGQEHGLKRMVETIRAAAAVAGLQMQDIAAVGVATPGTM